jgi:Flp pilus assembly protein TadD
MPGYTMAYSNWGIALAMQGRLAEAVGKLSEAVRRNPASASFHYNLGLALAKQGHVDQAVLEYQLALQIDPSFNKARDGLAGLSQPPRG